MPSQGELYENVAPHVIGVEHYDPAGNPTSRPLAPGSRVKLTEDDLELIAESHVREQDNPLAAGQLVRVAPRSTEAASMTEEQLAEKAERDDLLNQARAAGVVEPENLDNDALVLSLGQKAEVNGVTSEEGEEGDGVEPPSPSPLAEPGSLPEGEPEGEETAAAENGRDEEIGAAVEPDGEAPEGEYARHEEVGTPDAPAASRDDEE